jgi:hypothetical protein
MSTQPSTLVESIIQTGAGLKSLMHCGLTTIKALSVVVLLTSGCAGLGPAALQAGRQNYNVAIERTNSEQLLLNLVRLRYVDTPLFLQLTSVSTQFNFNASAQANFLHRSKSAETDELGIGTGLSYSEAPTITYAPLQGQEFVERILQPVRIDTLLLLFRSGWGIDRVLRLCVQQINGIQNAPSASGPIPSDIPTYVDFVQAAKLLRELQVRGVLDMGYEVHDGESVPVLRIIPRAMDWPEVKQLQNLLGLSPDQNQYIITTDISVLNPAQIGIATRSLRGIASYLSQAVEVPKRHEILGKVAIARSETGLPFNWNEMLGDLFQVRAQSDVPPDVAVAVRYRNYWFYISDVDLESKATFLLLTQLLNLQSGEIERAAPVLTLPVGG